MVETSGRRGQMSSRRGQAAIEYILLLSLVVGIIAGLFAGPFKNFFKSAQDTIGSQTREVVAQSPTLGTPFEWFAPAPADFSGVSGPGAGPVITPPDQAAAPGADASGGPGSRRKPGLGPKDGGGNTPASTTGSNTSPGSSSSTSAADSSADKDEAARRAKKAADDKSETSTAAQTGGSGGSDSSGSSVGVSGETSEDGKRSEVKEDDAKIDPASGVSGKARRYSRPEEQRNRGCADMDFATILKIVAVLALFLLGAAVLVTSKGQKGD